MTGRGLFNDRDYGIEVISGGSDKGTGEQEDTASRDERDINRERGKWMVEHYQGGFHIKLSENGFLSIKPYLVIVGALKMMTKMN